MSDLSVSFDRSSLSLSPLVVTNVPQDDGLWIDVIGRPDRAWRRSRVTSDSTHGASQTAAVLEHTGIPLTIYARATSAADLDALQTELEETLWQFVFPATFTENGVAKTWLCDCADIKWSDYDAGMADALMVSANITIPVYPIPS